MCVSKNEAGIVSFAAVRVLTRESKVCGGWQRQVKLGDGGERMRRGENCREIRERLTRFVSGRCVAWALGPWTAPCDPDWPRQSKARWGKPPPYRMVGNGFVGVVTGREGSGKGEVGVFYRGFTKLGGCDSLYLV